MMSPTSHGTLAMAALHRYRRSRCPDVVPQPWGSARCSWPDAGRQPVAAAQVSEPGTIGVLRDHGRRTSTSGRQLPVRDQRDLGKNVLDEITVRAPLSTSTARAGNAHQWIGCATSSSATPTWTARSRRTTRAARQAPRQRDPTRPSSRAGPGMPPRTPRATIGCDRHPLVQARLQRSSRARSSIQFGYTGIRTGPGPNGAATGLAGLLTSDRACTRRPSIARPARMDSLVDREPGLRTAGGRMTRRVSRRALASAPVLMALSWHGQPVAPRPPSARAARSGCAYDRRRPGRLAGATVRPQDRQERRGVPARRHPRSCSTICAQGSGWAPEHQWCGWKYKVQRAPTSDVVLQHESLPEHRRSRTPRPIRRRPVLRDGPGRHRRAWQRASTASR